MQTAYIAIYSIMLFLGSCFSIRVSNSAQDMAVQDICLGCALVKGELETIGGVIADTPHFQARQDYAVPIPGFVIIGSKRHIRSIDECTPEERADFIELLYTMRTCMRACLTVDTIYLIQEEDASHFHVWLFPRYEWMQSFGKKIRSVKPIMQWAKEHLTQPEAIRAVQDAAEKLRLAVLSGVCGA